MFSPTCFHTLWNTAVEPVKWKPAIFGWLTTYWDMSLPEQGTKLMTPPGRPHHWRSFM